MIKLFMTLALFGWAFQNIQTIEVRDIVMLNGSEVLIRDDFNFGDSFLFVEDELIYNTDSTEIKATVIKNLEAFENASIYLSESPPAKAGKNGSKVKYHSFLGKTDSAGNLSIKIPSNRLSFIVYSHAEERGVIVTLRKDE